MSIKKDEMVDEILRITKDINSGLTMKEEVGIIFDKVISEVIKSVKLYNNSIENIPDLLMFLDRVTKCFHCKRTFYDGICPDCAKTL